MLLQHLIQKLLNHKMSLYIQLQLQHRICKPLMYQKGSSDLELALPSCNSQLPAL